MRNRQTCSKELATLFLSNVELLFFQFCRHLLLFFVFKIAILMDVKQCLSKGLICVFLITNDVKQLSVSLPFVYFLW